MDRTRRRRWIFGLPPRNEPELAWLQHCLAHLDPTARAVLLMPPAAAELPSGRRIRAELIRSDRRTDWTQLRESVLCAWRDFDRHPDSFDPRLGTARAPAGHRPARRDLRPHPRPARPDRPRSPPSRTNSPSWAADCGGPPPS